MQLCFGYSALPKSDKLKNDITKAIKETELKITLLCKNFYDKNSKALRLELRRILELCEKEMNPTEFKLFKEDLLKQDKLKNDFFPRNNTS